MNIKILQTETGDILTRADTNNMRLPFEYGWPCWGVFDSRDELIDDFPTYSQAQKFVNELTSEMPLAA